MDKKPTLAIIGGGAVGLSSAIHSFYFGNNNINIIILEKNDRVGKKILATGNGRCNFTNINATYKNFYGEDMNFSKYFLEQFTVQDTLDFFYKLGVMHKILEQGKVYPYSEQASSILDALRCEIDINNIKTITDFEVCNIKTKNSKFQIISANNNSIVADKIIFATGGFSSQNLGSDGSGLKLLEKLGHSSTKVTPVLVQLKTNTEKIKALKGIKINGILKFYSNNKFLKQDNGEILFTEYGISGPPVFQLSTLFARYENIIAYIDFMPEFSEKDIINLLIDRKNNLNKFNMEHFFNGMLNKRIGNIIAKDSGIEKLSFPISSLNQKTIENMAYLIKNFKLNILDTNGFKNSQVTAGGLKTSEFNPKTLESNIIKGLYCAGEILDVFGDCGGYNLQWAWSSSYVCSRECVKSMLS